MKKYNIILFALLGLFCILSSCEKDGEEVKILENPVPPMLKTVPSDFTFMRDNADAILTFKGTSVAPGFTASATYFLEACAKDNNFVDVVELYSGIQDTTIKLSVGAVNQALLAKFPEDQTSSIDFRIRAVLEQAAGEGVSKMEYSSESVTADVTIYGLPALYITGDADNQRLVSANNNGIYIGWVKFSSGSFTLTNKDDGAVYGSGTSAGKIAKDGDAISNGSGIYYLVANLNNSTIDISNDESWGVIGSAVPPYDWSVDVNMIFDVDDQFWEVTGDFLKGEFKFRANDNWDLNYGDTDADGILDKGGDNIAIKDNGNYTIQLQTKESYKVIKN